jgi:hypothetical protein
MEIKLYYIRNKTWFNLLCFLFSFNLVKENVIFTPAIDGAILPGITRKTIIDIANDLGYKVFVLFSNNFCYYFLQTCNIDD